MTQYLLSVIHDWDAPPPAAEELQARFDAVDAFNNEIQANGTWVFGGGLEHPSTATVVTGSAGAAPVVSDGPYLEAKEHLGGFWVVEAPDLDAALDLAARASTACANPVEVRPFQAEEA
jgi:hypothetical protein